MNKTICWKKEKKGEGELSFCSLNFFCSLCIFVNLPRPCVTGQVLSIFSKVELKKKKKSNLFAWPIFFAECEMNTFYTMIAKIVFALWMMIVSIQYCRYILPNDPNPLSHWINSRSTNTIICKMLIYTLQGSFSWNQVWFGHGQGLTGTEFCLWQ